MNKLLRDMLTYRRPAGSRTERTFVTRFIDTIPGIETDEHGNKILMHPTSRTIITCHTDSVHRTGGKQRITERDGIAFLHPKERVSNCLGADDVAGVYAALRMIEAGVPATFIFHRAEEIGGVGSRALVADWGSYLEHFDRCVSLDRRGTSDVIMEQSGERCCSDKFAKALAKALGKKYKPTWGVFTDSASYTRYIHECTNVSVGYQAEHTALEHLDTVYLERLITALVRVDWESLPVDAEGSRDATPSPRGGWQRYFGYQDYSTTTVSEDVPTDEEMEEYERELIDARQSGMFDQYDDEEILSDFLYWKERNPRTN